jgi:non-ribosomal peptide synthetase component E (peptide arylation enzyme)
VTKVRRVPAEALLASPFAALPDIIRAHAAEHPDQLALVEGGEELTYAGLAALMDRIAFALQRDGVRAGKAVAICARTSINYAAAFCGVLAAGAAVVPLAPSSTPTSLMMMIRAPPRECLKPFLAITAILFLGFMTILLSARALAAATMMLFLLLCRK